MYIYRSYMSIYRIYDICVYVCVNMIREHVHLSIDC